MVWSRRPTDRGRDHRTRQRRTTGPNARHAPALPAPPHASSHYHNNKASGVNSLSGSAFKSLEGHAEMHISPSRLRGSYVGLSWSPGTLCIAIEPSTTARTQEDRQSETTCSGISPLLSSCRCCAGECYELEELAVRVVPQHACEQHDAPGPHSDCAPGQPSVSSRWRIISVVNAVI